MTLILTIVLYIFLLFFIYGICTHHTKRSMKPILLITLSDSAQTANILSTASVNMLLKLNTYNTKFVSGLIPNGYNGMCDIKVVVDGEHVTANSFSFGKSMGDFWNDLDHRLNDVI